MSTRAHIKITDGHDSFCLYHHHDGYPQGVGNDIKKYLESINFFTKPKYCPDHYIEAICLANKMVKGIFSILYDDIDTQYDLTTGLHGDEEFCYHIDCKRRELHCYRVSWDDSNPWNQRHELDISEPG